LLACIVFFGFVSLLLSLDITNCGRLNYSGCIEQPSCFWCKFDHGAGCFHMANTDKKCTKLNGTTHHGSNDPIADWQSYRNAGYQWFGSFLAFLIAFACIICTMIVLLFVFIDYDDDKAKIRDAALLNEKSWCCLSTTKTRPMIGNAALLKEKNAAAKSTTKEKKSD